MRPMAPAGGTVPLAGCLITVEGGEGSGKTTQCGLLVKWLQEGGLRVVSAREPGGTRLAERLREILLDPTLERLSPEAEVLLFAAARAQAVAEVITPALAAGCIVICDRFIDSSAAYQGYGLGVDLAFISGVNLRVTGGLRPDKTLLLDVSRAAAKARRSGAESSADRIERRREDYHEAVRRGYLKLAAAEPERFAVINAARSSVAVQGDARRAVATVLRSKGYFVSEHPGEGEGVDL